MSYYEDRDHISNSNLGWLLRSPAYFKKKMGYAQAEKLESLSLERGTLLHMAILEPNKFIVSDVEPVGGMMGKFIELLAKHPNEKIDGTSMIVDTAHKASGFKHSLEVVLKNFEKPENQAYYEFLKSANGKVCLTKEDKDVIDKCIESLSKHKAAASLLFDKDLPDLFEKDQTYNELPIYWVYQVIDEKGDTYEVPCKSLIDRLVIDHTEGLIKVIDLKTTSKSVGTSEATRILHTGNVLQDYEYTGFLQAYVNMYRYYRQQAYYEFAVMYYLATHPDHKDVDYTDYRMISYCVAVETTGMNECGVFEIPAGLIAAGEREFNELIKRYVWHLDSDQWEYSKEYYLGDGILRPEVS